MGRATCWLGCGVGDAVLELTCDLAALAAALQIERVAHAPAKLTFTVAGSLRGSGRTLRLVRPNGAVPSAPPDAALVRLLLLARRWWNELRRGELDITQLAAREARSTSYVTRIVRLAFLSPQVTRAILSGKQRAGVDVATLTCASPCNYLKASRPTYFFRRDRLAAKPGTILACAIQYSGSMGCVDPALFSNTGDPGS